MKIRNYKPVNWTISEQNKKFFREALLALGVTVVGGLLTGIVWSSLHNPLLAIPGIIALIPVISQMRGSISGTFTARLGTGLHLGIIRPSYKERTKELTNSIYAYIILSFVIPLWVALMVYLFHHFGGGPTPLIRFLTIGLIGSLLAGAVQINVTLSIAFLVYKRGMDPDVIVFPVLSFIADVTTAIAIFVAFSIEMMIYPFMTSFLQVLIELLSLFIFALFLISIFSRPIKSKLEFEVMNLLSEIGPVILITAIVGSIIGIILDAEIPYEGVILILPIYMAYNGATGSIVGNTFTTAYHLGAPMKRYYITTPIILLLIGIILGLFLAIIGYSVSIILNFSLPDSQFTTYLLICMITAIFSTIFSVLDALIVGNISFKKGLDADNIIVPATSTIGDLVAILSIVLLLSILT